MKLKLLFVLMLLLCSTIVSAQAIDDVDPGVTPDSKYMWMLERGFEKLSETIGTAQSRERARERHQQERIAEAEQMIIEGKAQHAQKAMEKVRERVRGSDTEDRYMEQFRVTKEVMDGVKDRINIELKSELAQKYIMSEAKVLFMLKEYNNEFKYYSVTIEDRQITTIVEVPDESGEYTHQLVMNHGEFHALQQANKASLYGHLKDIQVFGEQNRIRTRAMEQNALEAQNQEANGVQTQSKQKGK